MKLSRQTIRCIADTAEHYRDNQDLTPESAAILHCELDNLYHLCHDVPVRFTIEIKRIELVPETTDLMLNYVVKELLVFLEEDEQNIELENAVWEYLLKVHEFDPEDHHLLKHTTEEALSYAFNHLGISVSCEGF